MSQALYRKYRPKSLAEVVGENQVTDILSNSLKTQKISHAYLFVGPRGCGKTSVARIFAHEVNNFPYELEDNYVDIIEIDAASNNSVENIRDLKEKACVAPSKGKYKVYIIDEVHMLSKSAFNALLKILEEPPKHVIFIMATTDAYKVPVTITSRSQIYTFKLADKDTMFEHLKKICQKESINIEDDALKILVRRGEGSFRDTLSLLDQVSTISSPCITVENLNQSLGILEDELIDKITEYFLQKNVEKISSILKEIFSRNTKAEIIVEELINKILLTPTPNLLPLLAKLIEIKSPFIEAKLLVALCNFDSQNYATSAPQAATIAAQPTSETPLPQPSDFMAALKIKDIGLYQQLIRAEVKQDEDTIHIYPKTSSLFKILNRENYKLILIEVANGKKIKIHEVGEHKKSLSNDPTISKISDIMGGVEEENGGEVPF